MPLNSPKKAKMVSVLALLACGSVFVSQRPESASVDKRLYVQIGQTLGAEGLKLLKSGGKVTIIARDTEEYRQPTMATAVASLQREIRRAGAEIRSVELIQLDPIRPVEVASGDFYQVLRRCTSGDVVISLLGAPHLSEEHKAKLGKPKARIVALCPGTGSGEELLKTDWLDVAVVNKAGSGGKKFEDLYTVVKAGSL